jgi:vacuolar protein sorting-associated protein 13A/C
MAALTQSSQITNLHLLEKINIGLSVQNSIVPSVLSLARFKVHGTLPQLQVNFSDTKYKALMRFVDIVIPNFQDEKNAAPSVPSLPSVRKEPNPQLQSSFYVDTHEEYHVTEEDHEEEEGHVVRS